MNLHEMSAEMLLEHLYPELTTQWKVTCEGTFYRNYNADVMSADATTTSVYLARDGMTTLLPEMLLATEDELHGKDALAKHEMVKRRIQTLRTAFSPFDSFHFQQRLKVERQVSQLLNNKLDYILRTYFDIVLDEIDNPWVNQMACLLPYVSHMRGDIGQLRQLLSILVEAPVRMEMRRYSDIDNTRTWIPQLRMRIVRPDLTAQQYRQQMAELRPLQDFLQEWFMPAEVMLTLELWHPNVSQEIGMHLTANYNMTLRQ